MHVHFQSKLQAKKALSKNGKVYGGRMMIGVLPCIDKVGSSDFYFNINLIENQMVKSWIILICFTEGMEWFYFQYFSNCSE